MVPSYKILEVLQICDTFQLLNCYPILVMHFSHVKCELSHTSHAFLTCCSEKASKTIVKRAQNATNCNHSHLHVQKLVKCTSIIYGVLSKARNKVPFWPLSMPNRIWYQLWQRCLARWWSWWWQLPFLQLDQMKV